MCYVAAVPIDKPIAAIDEPALVQCDERVLDGPRQVVVHSEGLAAPVDGRAESSYLLVDAVTIGVLPLPHLLDERLASQVVPRLLPLPHQLLLHYDLSGYTRVIGAGQPEHVAASHALVAHDGILDGAGECVAEMQCAGHVGRRDDNHESLGRRVAVLVAQRLIQTLRLPPRVPVRLNRTNVVRIRHRLTEVLHPTRHNDCIVCGFGSGGGGCVCFGCCGCFLVFS